MFRFGTTRMGTVSVNDGEETAPQRSRPTVPKNRSVDRWTRRYVAASAVGFACWRTGALLGVDRGVQVLAVGQLIFVWNVVVSWLEGARVEDGDPWNLAERGLRTREWEWFAERRETALADGGESSE
jgi:hypothetical protein